MPSRRRLLHVLATSTVAALAGCSFGGEYHDFEADNRSENAETVRVGWEGNEEQFSLGPGESVARRDLLPDADREVRVAVGTTEETVDWRGDGPTLYVDIEPDGVDVGQYYDD